MSQIARDLGITPGAVSHWELVPLARLIEVEQITGISRRKLRPDLFAAPQAKKPAKRNGRRK
jgi:hypothetical protein